MKSPLRWLVLGILSSALLLIVIDMTVIYLALPSLTYELRATANEKLWIVNAYALTVAGLLPGMGALGDRFGHKRMFVAGLVVFGLASLGAAFSPSPALLIAARVALAVGAAMMMPATLAIIRHVFDDDRERALAFGIWAAIASGGAAFGPVVGGVLLEHFWWGSVFIINVPIVLLALVLALRWVPTRPGNPERPFDLLASLWVMGPGRPDAGHQGSRQGRLLAPASLCGGNRGSDLQPGFPATSAASDDSHDRLHPVP